jgi:hypothetical protein
LFDWWLRMASVIITIKGPLLLFYTKWCWFPIIFLCKRKRDPNVEQVIIYRVFFFALCFGKMKKMGSF